MSTEQTIEELIEEKVNRFAEEMKKTLLRNAHEKGKGSWMGLDLDTLGAKFNEEMREFDHALNNESPEAITLEATDVASVAMMLRDNFGSQDKKIYSGKCITDSFSSRVCENGTKCCTVYHVDIADKSLDKILENVKDE